MSIFASLIENARFEEMKQKERMQIIKEIGINNRHSIYKNTILIN